MDTNDRHENNQDKGNPQQDPRRLKQKKTEKSLQRTMNQTWRNKNRVE